VTGTTAEVALSGELDISTYEDALAQLAAAERSAPELLVVDLAGLRFVDSTGVRLVLSADERRGRRAAASRCASATGLPAGCSPPSAWWTGSRCSTEQCGWCRRTSS
jgi:anti-anti-sigma factor